MAQRYQSRLAQAQPVQDNRPQLFRSLADRISAFASREADAVDRQVAKKAKEQGRADAQGKIGIELRDGTTIADEAWNEGAIVSHVAALKLDIAENTSRIEIENPRDPEAYAASAKGYSKGLLEGVPEKLQPAIQDELSSIILKSGSKIMSERRSFERDQHLAQTATAISLYRTEAENYAKEGEAEAATEGQIKAIELTNALESSGLLSPKAAEVQRGDITRDIEDQIIYGAFARDAQKGKGLQYISRFNKLKTLGDRDPDYRKKMAAEMVSMLDKTHKAEANKRKEEDAARKAYWRQGEKEISTLDLDGALTIEHLQKYVDEGKLDPKIAAKYKKAATLDGPEFSDQIEINLIKQDPLAYTEFDINVNPALSREDKTSLILERRELEEDKGNWKATQNGREGARRINHAFGIIKGVDTRITAEKAQRAGMVLTRYYNEIENLPLEEKEYRAIEISDRLVKEVNNEILTASLEKARESLAKSPYQTMKDIDAADLDSVKDPAARKILKRKLTNIERLEHQIGQ